MLQIFYRKYEVNTKLFKFFNKIFLFGNLFDESLNVQIENIQMDFIIRFWNESTKIVLTK